MVLSDKPHMAGSYAGICGGKPEENLHAYKKNKNLRSGSNMEYFKCNNVCMCRVHSNFLSKNPPPLEGHIRLQKPERTSDCTIFGSHTPEALQTIDCYHGALVF